MSHATSPWARARSTRAWSTSPRYRVGSAVIIFISSGSRVALLLQCRQLVVDELEQRTVLDDERWHVGTTFSRVRVEGEHCAAVKAVAAEDQIPSSQVHLDCCASGTSEGLEVP